MLAWLAVAGILVLFTLALTWLAVIPGLTAKSADGASAFSYPLIFLPFISSAFVPTDTMPGPVRAFAEHQPVTSIVNAIRDLFAQQPVGTDIWIALAWCVGILVVAYAFAMAHLPPQDRLVPCAAPARTCCARTRPIDRWRPERPSRPLSQLVRELRARLHVELAERLAQVVLDRARADEELRGDLAVGVALRREARDLRLLRRELVERVDGPLAGMLACRLQLDRARARRTPPSRTRRRARGRLAARSRASTRRRSRRSHSP